MNKFNSFLKELEEEKEDINCGYRNENEINKLIEKKFIIKIR